MSKIPYPLNQIKAVVFDIDGVLSPTEIPVGDDGIPRRMANIRDGYAIVKAIASGLIIGVITGAVSPGVAERMKLLGITDFHAGKMDKLPVLLSFMEKYGLKPDEVAYVGDDVPDVAPMKYVGLAVTPRDGSADTYAVANYVASACGGRGVARELLEEIMRDRGTWPGESVSYG